MLTLLFSKPIKVGWLLSWIGMTTEKKMTSHLCNNGSYKKLINNPIKKVSKVVALAIKSSSTVSSIRHKLIESNLFTPRIYGLPKIHKEAPQDL